MLVLSIIVYVQVLLKVILTLNKIFVYYKAILIEQYKESRRPSKTSNQA